MTAIYSILHLLVDGICALSMFGSFLSDADGYFLMLLYNFCAFALQMPIGVLVDMAQKKGGQGRDPALWTAAAGILLTMAGALTHPAVLGLGNALFHVGGGVGCIREDDARGWKGRGLGVFVAPGAMGLYLGMLLAGQGVWEACFLGGSALMAVLCAGMLYLGGLRPDRRGRQPVVRYIKEGLQETPAGRDERAACPERRGHGAGLWGSALVPGCLLVVILRSYIGMAVTFPWKTGIWAGFAAVLAIAGGKAAGGFAAARHGTMRTAIASLALAAVCYPFSSVLPVGLAALFLFNMTMPITLYWMMRHMPGMPGFAFGALTFGLFLGFLPGYFGLLPQAGGKAVGCVGSVVSLLLLWLAGRRKE